MFQFWSGGDEAYESELDQEFQQRRKSLEFKLTIAADPEERNRLRQELRRLKAGYREKKRGAKWNLYAAHRD